MNSRESAFVAARDLSNTQRSTRFASFVCPESNKTLRDPQPLDSVCHLTPFLSNLSAAHIG
jgi:hypothetical protein